MHRKIAIPTVDAAPFWMATGFSAVSPTYNLPIVPIYRIAGNFHMVEICIFRIVEHHPKIKATKLS